MKQIIYIISGGNNYSSDDFYLKNIKKANINIACDSGIKIYKKMNFIPDYLIGDMDSAKTEDIEWAKKNKVKILKYPSEKDEIDTELALILANDLRIKDVVLSNVTGTRIDQTIASIYLIAKYDNLNAIIREENIEIGIIKSKKTLKAIKGETWSIIQIGGKVEGISLVGFKYKLKDYNLDEYTPLGISNEAISDEVEIELKTGNIAYIRTIGKKA
ncbi:thiamine pyrophosphokinase [Oceanotoga teriensis]|uniref:Thiamine diphosphokinase n=1 Tax=Oceanotoga teriensis TaxID=515440 RepID=A0AA45C8M8_9BACT|nr:thiamine diphosphokinase [Oceanotoga teriensis]PWJ96156.1 thiamine pyrophosphokinase [Oceanotoga teriensis]